jgi:hypothetical protein
MKVGRCEVHEIPKDGQSLNVLGDRKFYLSGRSFFRRFPCLSKDGRKKDDQFLVCVIPKDGQNEKLAYARLLNLNRGNRNHVILNHESRYRKVYLTSSFFLGGRRLVLRCEAYLSTRALERGHLI